VCWVVPDVLWEGRLAHFDLGDLVSLSEGRAIYAAVSSVRFVGAVEGTSY
jgi:hypothetical protein